MKNNLMVLKKEGGSDGHTILFLLIFGRTRHWLYLFPIQKHCATSYNVYVTSFSGVLL